MKRLAVIFVAVSLRAACVPVAGDHILTGDLARAIPEFAEVDAAQVIGFAPVPGTERNLSLREIGMLSRRFGLNIDLTTAPGACFERDARRLTAAEIQKSMQESLTGKDAHVEVLDFTRSPMPEGKLVFTLSAASRPPAAAPDAPIFWRGRLVTESGRTFSIWARVRITVNVPLVTAKAFLSKGQTIRPEDLLPVQGKAPFLAGCYLKSENSAVGRLAKHDIAAGQPITADALEEPKDVFRGEAVHVESTVGLAQLSFEAQARTAGRKGDTILVQNPSNGRSFHAVVIEKGRVQAKAALK